MELIILVIIFWLIILIIGLLYRYWKRKRYIKRVFSMTSKQRELEMVRIQSNLTKYQTKHWIHLILTICTLGCWMFFWLLFTIGNQIERKQIELFMKDLVDSQEMTEKEDGNNKLVDTVVVDQTSQIQELEKLVSLKEKGILSDEEFQKLKSDLIDRI